MFVMVGGSTSLTTMDWLHESELLPPSVAVQAMVVMPTGYGAVSGSASLRRPAIVTGQPSAWTVGSPGFTTAEHNPGSFPTVRSAGQEMLSSPWPSPVAATVADGVTGSLLAMVSVADFGPRLVGVKRAVKDWQAPAAIVTGNEAGTENCAFDDVIPVITRLVKPVLQTLTGAVPVAPAQVAGSVTAAGAAMRDTQQTSSTFRKLSMRVGGVGGVTSGGLVADAHTL